MGHGPATSSGKDLSTSEVAQSLGVHVNTVYNLLNRGAFPNAYQLSEKGDWRIPAADVVAFREARSVKAKAVSA